MVKLIALLVCLACVASYTMADDDDGANWPETVSISVSSDDESLADQTYQPLGVWESEEKPETRANAVPNQTRCFFLCWRSKVVQVSDNAWKAYDNEKELGTYVEIERTSDASGEVVKLKNQNDNAGDTSYLELTSNGAYAGANPDSLQKVADGKFVSGQKARNSAPSDDGALVADAGESPARLTWTDATENKHFFQRVSGKRWAQYFNKIFPNIIAYWTEVKNDARTQEVTLRLENKSPVVFVKLTPTDLFVGSTNNPTQKLVSGKWNTPLRTLDDDNVPADADKVPFFMCFAAREFCHRGILHGCCVNFWRTRREACNFSCGVCRFFPSCKV